jgi:hypothetical protein
MNVMNSLRKGLRFFLMSFGVSSPNKSRPAQSPVGKKPPGQPSGDSPAGPRN